VVQDRIAHLLRTALNPGEAGHRPLVDERRQPLLLPQASNAGLDETLASISRLISESVQEQETDCLFGDRLDLSHHGIVFVQSYPRFRGEVSSRIAKGVSEVQTPSMIHNTVSRNMAPPPALSYAVSGKAA
jgi:hypothetical protein